MLLSISCYKVFSITTEDCKNKNNLTTVIRKLGEILLELQALVSLLISKGIVSGTFKHYTACYHSSYQHSMILLENDLVTMFSFTILRVYTTYSFCNRKSVGDQESEPVPSDLKSKNTHNSANTPLEDCTTQKYFWFQVIKRPYCIT